MRRRNLKRESLYHLKQTFGLDAYRPGQKAAVHALLSGRDVLCILPTGAGKSLCWQLPALVHPGLTVVVSPLIALMHDQVQHLAALGVPAASLDSLMTPQERELVIQNIRAGRVRIVFVSPERLEQPAFRRLCQDMAPWLIVVDEAHCVVQWGESFREAYKAIPDFISVLTKSPVICALTATADKDMRKAVVSALGMRSPRRILMPIHRENLVYSVHTTLNRTGEILRICQRAPCRTVIFCRTRARCEALSGLLGKHGVDAAYYHAGMERAQRLSVQQRFQDGTVEVLCATTAFGMGVDIPDIRRVIHDEVPDHVIDYVQQSGRCGRDGKPAECILLFEPDEFIRTAVSAARQKAECRWRLTRYIALRKSWLEQRRLMKILFTSPCIPAGIVAAFGKRIKPCGGCSACLHGPKLRRLPAVHSMQAWQVRAWLLRWQRDALAEKTGVPARMIARDRVLNKAARTLILPDDARLPEELARLLAHFRQKG